jgi:type II secretory pathway component PulM
VIERAREWWGARVPRERAVIAGAGAALGLAVLWAYVWVPIEADRARLADALPPLRAAAAAVARAAAEVERLRATVRARGGGAASESGLDDALKASGLGPGYGGLSALGDGRVQVNLRAVPFDALARALAHLADAHGVAVERIALKASGEPGRVQVESLVLRVGRGGQGR